MFHCTTSLLLGCIFWTKKSWQIRHSDNWKGCMWKKVGNHWIRVTKNVIPAAYINIMRKIFTWTVWHYLALFTLQFFTTIIKHFEQFPVMFWPEIKMCICKPEWHIIEICGWQQHRNGAVMMATMVNIFWTHHLIHMANNTMTGSI